VNGAQALIRTLVRTGVDTCFANPGTSEMHFVASLDAVPEMHGVLTLFEGVATGAADGYARVTGRPAATLLHLGPGLGNGIANLHNARRAHSPVVNIVGDHATYHKRFDAPLESDIESLARPVSGWYRMSLRPEDVAADACDAVVASLGPPGRVATLVLPADVGWSEAASDPVPVPRPPWPARASSEAIADAAKALTSGEPAALLVGGSACKERALVAANRAATATGAKLLGETFPALLDRGAGLPPLERLGYFAEFVEAQLGGVRHLVLAGAAAPVSFFAYPGRASSLVPDGCEVHELGDGSCDLPAALEELADAVGAPSTTGPVAQPGRPDAPSGPLTLESLATAVGATLPDHAVVVDESNTSGLFIAGATAGCPRHQWLTLTGGAIGQGLPAATGAAIGAPGRPVVCLQADGSAMYTMQALWTQAHESLDVTTLLLSNRSYAILNLELGRVGAESGPRARAMLDLSGPELDFVAIASGMGVPATRVEDAEALVAALTRSFAGGGPSLIEVVLPAFG